MKSEQSTPIRFTSQSPLRVFAAEAADAYRSPFRDERQLKIAKAGIRFDASVKCHVLGPFRQCVGKPAYQEAFCANCGAGVSIHVATSEASVSELLAQPCVLADGVRR